MGVSVSARGAWHGLRRAAPACHQIHRLLNMLRGAGGVF